MSTTEVKVFPSIIAHSKTDRAHDIKKKVCTDALFPVMAVLGNQANVKKWR